VACVNERNIHNSKKYNEATDAFVDPLFKSYLNEKLAHLNREERRAIEPILRKYRKVFYVEGSNDFQGTDLIEHQITTGDAKPIMKAPYRVPFALRKEMEAQVQDMLNKGVNEPSSSPWSAPVVLTPKRSQDGNLSIGFA
jgi:hypothetical protein